ncbi:MAG: hypothetical protein O2917_00060 [Acidobacteria bacterium]|nr:hypothetical protein [Acidobacteriota bacterium]
MATILSELEPDGLQGDGVGAEKTCLRFIPMRYPHPSAVGIALLLGLLAAPAVVSAQSVAIGPRLSLVRGDLATDTPSSRLFGGTMRMRSSSFTALELSMDYRVTHNEARTERVRETPMQASLLVMPFQSLLAPYALGGVGLYSSKVDLMGPENVILDSSLERRIGWHAGFGAELKLGRRAGVPVHQLQSQR